MSDLYKELSPHIKDLKTCTNCGAGTVKDLFQVQLEKRKKLIEAIACHECNIIFEVLPE